MIAAESTRELQENLVWPSSFSLKEYIRMGQILNFPYTEDAVDIGEAVFGPQVPILQGKMIREKQRHVKNIPRTIIPHELVKKILQMN